MIDQTIQSKARFSLGAALFFLVGILLVVIAVVQQNVHCAIASALPWMIGVFLWLTRPRGFVAHFTETTLEVMDPPLSLPYGQIEGFRPVVQGNRFHLKGVRAFPIQIFHEDGVVEIPAAIDAPSREVYAFLQDQLPPGGSHDVNPVLADYLKRQEETFGADRVWSYRARRRLGKLSGRRRARAVCLACMLAGIVWIIAGTQGKAFQGWLGGGITMLLFGGLFYLLFWLTTSQKMPRIANWGKASLVVSPLGLAIVQGDLKGELRWDELRKVHTKMPQFAFQLTRADLGPGIRLVVEGATIVIADIYDRPLQVIYQRIKDYWQPDQPEA
jgi:hypothetical protein